MKVSEMKDLALAWAVAQCEGYRGIESLTKPDPLDDGALEHRWLREYSPPTNWSQGGPIIERENIEIFIRDEKWFAYSSNSTPEDFYGETPLVAAMRCYVASVLGDEVDVPEELQ